MSDKPKKPTKRELSEIARGKKCFVIMPYGRQSLASGGPVVNFNEVYNVLIKPTVEGEGMKMQCIRCDEEDLAGPIHARMFEHIYDAEVAVVEISAPSANVFYELGVRHALAESVTILLARKGTKIPFNINGVNVILYDGKNDEVARERIRDFIRNGLWNGTTDSQIRAVLNSKVPKGQPIDRTTTYRYCLKKAPSKEICLITGDLIKVKTVDVWVSSENTNMEMARFFDSSISANIRYYGAKRSRGKVTSDVIANELRRKAPGAPANVSPGEIIVTGSGELKKTNNVKMILHAAAVTGQAGRGYVPIKEISVCVHNALNKAEEKQFSKLKLKSILFPLMGTGTARGDLRQKAPELIGAAISWLEANPQSRIDRVCFLTWSRQDLEVCRQVLRHADEVEEISAPAAKSRK